MTFQIEISPLAREQLAKIRDRRVLGKIRDRIDELKVDPEKQGDPLRDELSGYRSVRAVGQRYRIIYKVMHDRVVVAVFAVGLRREDSPEDIYKQATKQIRKMRAS